MKTSVECDHCGNPMSIDRPYVGRTIECDACGNPFVARPTARIQEKIPAAKVKCPYCAEDIRKDAIVCKHCSRSLIDKEDGGYAKSVTVSLAAVFSTLLILVGLSMMIDKSGAWDDYGFFMECFWFVSFMIVSIFIGCHKRRVLFGVLLGIFVPVVGAFVISLFPQRKV